MYILFTILACLGLQTPDGTHPPWDTPEGLQTWTIPSPFEDPKKAQPHFWLFDCIHLVALWNSSWTCRRVYDSQIKFELGEIQNLARHCSFIQTDTVYGLKNKCVCRMSKNLSLPKDTCQQWACSCRIQPYQRKVPRMQDCERRDRQMYGFELVQATLLWYKCLSKTQISRAKHTYTHARLNACIHFLLTIWAFISFHFGLLGFHFLSFWPFTPLFPFILVFWAFISFHSGLLGFHFLSFWSFRPSFPFILAFSAFVSFHFGFLGLHFLSFWSFGPSFPFKKGFLACHFLSF